jgi:hypothetical protein
MNAAATPAYRAGGMDLFPVAAREARVASRRWWSYDIRVAIAGILVLVAYLRMTTPLRGEIGPPLFHTLTMMAYLYCLFAGAFRTFDTLSWEKREGTLGLLLLTDLKPVQILLGKLLSSTAVTFFGLLAMMPVLTVPFLLGGITFEQFSHTCVNLLNTLLLSMSWGLLISACTRTYLVGLSLAVAAPFVFGIMPVGLIERLNPADPTNFPRLILMSLPSPTLAHSLAGQTDANLSQFFWPALGFNFVLACSWFLAALYFFPRCWLETPGKATALRKVRDAWNRWRFGDARQRTAHRKQLLLDNPLLWLADRDRVSAGGLTALCAAILAFSPFVLSPEFGLLLASLAIAYRMAHAASHSISEDQKNGALELLLGTQLTVDEIMEGLNRAMLWRFLPPVALVILWPWLFMRSSVHFFQPLVICSSVLLIATWIALSWVGLWYALRKSPTAAAWTSLAVVALPAWLTWLVSILPALFDPSMIDIREIGAVVCSLVGVFHCVLVAKWAFEMLQKNFREAAADPYGKIRFEPLLSPPHLGAPFNLTVVPIGKGKVKVHSAEDGSTMIFAIPKPNETFLGWGGDMRGNENPLHLELQGNAFIYARFTNRA